jgi:hypothetical protein
MAASEAREHYIGNAGIVLLWPFLGAFFRAIGLLEGKDFPGAAQRERAVLLLQYVATGEETRHPEPLLLLNKLLCGWDWDEPVAASLNVGEGERRQCLELLESVIGHWSAIGRTSIPGLRAAFLLRDGRLRAQDNGWSLLIGRRGHDVLVDRLPWGLGVVRNPWMRETVFVEW